MQDNTLLSMQEWNKLQLNCIVCLDKAMLSKFSAIQMVYFVLYSQFRSQSPVYMRIENMQDLCEGQHLEMKISRKRNIKMLITNLSLKTTQVKLNLQVSVKL